MKGPHGEVVGAAVVERKLLGEVIQREEGVTGIKALLVLSMASFHLAVVARRVRTGQLMTDSKLSSSFLKPGRDFSLTVGETVGKFKTVVGLDAFHPDASAGIPLNQSFQKVCGRISCLLRIGGQETQTGEFINGSILVQAQLRVGHAAAGATFTSTWTRCPG
mgnify:CR=1 FL=1